MNFKSQMNVKKKKKTLLKANIHQLKNLVLALKTLHFALHCMLLICEGVKLLILTCKVNITILTLLYIFAICG